MNLRIVSRLRLLIMVEGVEMRIWRIFFVMERQKDFVEGKKNLLLANKSFIVED